MSEYQYYEFQAIDRKLGEKEMRALRQLSTRASITATSFINEYNYGDFRGSPETLMERYFDAHLYLANWGSHRLMLRLPRRLLDAKTAAQYCVGRLAEARKKGEFVILDFNAEDDSGDGDWEEGHGQLASLIPIRDEMRRGDLRALYLGWLLCAQAGEVDEDDVEPPVPAGLGKLSASLEHFAEFLRIDPALIEVAAEGQSAREKAAGGESLAAWIDALPPAKKNEWLFRLAKSDDSQLRAELQQAFRRSQAKLGEGQRGIGARRSAGALLAAARERAEENERKEQEREIKERARAEAQAERARKRRLSALAKDEPAAWRKVEAYIATAQPAGYDDAVRLLQDLRDLAVRDGKVDSFGTRLNALRMRHQTKSGLRRRIKQADLLSTAGV